jgi:hypothetical protein
MNEHRGQNPAAGSVHKIVVVSGLPRSGTSMAMRMLHAGGLAVVSDGVRVADENNPKGYFEDERVKHLIDQSDKSWVADAYGKAIKVVSPLLPYLPDKFLYKVIFMNRDLRKVLASQTKMLGRRKRVSDVTDVEMERSFSRHLSRIKEFLASEQMFHTLEVQYEIVFRDPVSEAVRIRNFLGAELDVNAMAGAVDKQLHRNRI